MAAAAGAGALRGRRRTVEVKETAGARTPCCRTSAAEGRDREFAAVGPRGRILEPQGLGGEMRTARNPVRPSSENGSTTTSEETKKARDK